MKLYNTLSGELEEFTPSGDVVKMYVCGITPYAPCHLGHAMSYVIFDVLRRYLEYLGHNVQHVQNFTDVDDKIIQRSLEERTSPDELADRHIAEYMQSMDALNVKRAAVYPRATQEIPKIIEVTGSLIDKGYAYASDGDVYFRVSRSPKYGKLSHRTLDGMMAGARVEVDYSKENPMDFVLWKGAKPGEPSWESPWGPGRPGWHIECTAMALGYLGETLDIHGGGQDLVFPHHENETAQSEAYTGKQPFTRHWVHNGLLHMGHDKMSKSLGNLVSLQESLRRYSSDTLRIFFLSSHYRSPLTYNDTGLPSTDRLRNALRPEHDEGGDLLDPEPFKARFLEAMDTDLNTPQALAALFDLARAINRGRESGLALSRAQDTLRSLGSVLGLTFEQPSNQRRDDGSPFIDLLVDVRKTLRAAKQYELADEIRSRLADLGVALEDSADGSSWTYQ